MRRQALRLKFYVLGKIDLISLDLRVLKKEEKSLKFSRYILLFLGLLNIALAIRIVYALW